MRLAQAIRIVPAAGANSGQPFQNAVSFFGRICFYFSNLAFIHCHRFTVCHSSKANSSIKKINKKIHSFASFASFVSFASFGSSDSIGFHLTQDGKKHEQKCKQGLLNRPNLNIKIEQQSNIKCIIAQHLSVHNHCQVLHRPYSIVCKTKKKQKNNTLPDCQPGQTSQPVRVSSNVFLVCRFTRL